MNWQFKREEQQFDIIPEGKYRVRIDNAEMAESKKGNDMIILTLAVSGQSSRLWYYIVFLDDRPEITNRNLTAIFDSFGIPDGDLSLSSWIGKAGACTVKHEEYNGDMRARVGYFIPKSKQDGLPAWQGDDAPAGGGFYDVPKDQLPF